MTRYRIEMAKALRDLIPHLPPVLKRKVKAALRSIADDPYQAKELKEELAGLRSYRIARARLIYRIKGSVVEIVAFGPRADIYERAAVELSKSLRQSKSDKNNQSSKAAWDSLFLKLAAIIHQLPIGADEHLFKIRPIEEGSRSTACLRLAKCISGLQQIRLTEHGGRY